MRQASCFLQGMYVLCILKRDGGCLSVARDRLIVVCRECMSSVSYLRQVDGYLQGLFTLPVTWDNRVVMCQLHETGWRLSIGVCNMPVT